MAHPQFPIPSYPIPSHSVHIISRRNMEGPKGLVIHTYIHVPIEPLVGAARFSRFEPWLDQKATTQYMTPSLRYSRFLHARDLRRLLFCTWTARKRTLPSVPKHGVPGTRQASIGWALETLLLRTGYCILLATLSTVGGQGPHLPRLGGSTSRFINVIWNTATILTGTYSCAPLCSLQELTARQNGRRHGRGSSIYQLECTYTEPVAVSTVSMQCSVLRTQQSSPPHPPPAPGC